MQQSIEYNKGQADSLWQWVPASEFRLPPATVKASVINRIKAFISRLSSKKPEKQVPRVDAEKLQALSESMVASVVPHIPWADHAADLDAVLGPFLKSDQTHGLVLVNIPHTGTDEMLSCWAAKNDCRIIDPPSAKAILSADETWLDSFASSDGTWVLPRLEACYLRHENGLHLVRNFFQRLMSGKLGPGIIGCDSWAWSFFKHALDCRTTHELVTRAFDAENLSLWFVKLSQRDSTRPIVFRHSDTGRVLMTAGAGNDEIDRAYDSSFLKDLAFYSRGIPGVALACWRESLRGAPDSKKIEQKQAENRPDHQVIWVQPFSSLATPKIPAQAGRDHAFVLHCLLLHNGLSETILNTLLPMPAGQLSQIITELKAAGLIKAIENRWRLSPLGYPVAREFLAGEGYLLDDF